MAARVAEEWLNACSGCEISIVDLGERLLDVLNLVEFVHIPVLMDNKYYGQLGDKHHLELPEADVGIITGSLRNEEHLEVAEEMRRKCGLIIALGTCATHGGNPRSGELVPKQRNFRPVLFDRDDRPGQGPAGAEPRHSKAPGPGLRTG